MSDKLYTVRDIMDNRLSEIYCIHVQAMTEEGLHSKSDIAAELAWRDLQLNDFADKAEQLERERDELAAQVERLRIAAIESQDWDWISAKEAADAAGHDFFEIDDMQRLWDLVRSETPPAALEALKSQWQAEAVHDFVDAVVVEGEKELEESVYLWDVYDVKDFSLNYLKRVQEAGNE